MSHPEWSHPKNKTNLTVKQSSCCFNTQTLFILPRTNKTLKGTIYIISFKLSNKFDFLRHLLIFLFFDKDTEEKHPSSGPCPAGKHSIPCSIPVCIALSMFLLVSCHLFRQLTLFWHPGLFSILPELFIALSFIVSHLRICWRIKKLASVKNGFYLLNKPKIKYIQNIVLRWSAQGFEDSFFCWTSQQFWKPYFYLFFNLH